MSVKHKKTVLFFENLGAILHPTTEKNRILFMDEKESNYYEKKINCRSFNSTFSNSSMSGGISFYRSLYGQQRGWS